MANKNAEVPISEGVQGTDTKDLVAEFMEALYLEDSEATMFQLGEGSDQDEELPGNVVGKDDHSKTRKDVEEVIQAASNLVDLEQVIKIAEEVGVYNRGYDLE